MKKETAYILAALAALCSCSDSPEPPAPVEQSEEFYICLDLPQAEADSRVSYEYSDIFYEWGDGNLAARWEAGDFIKIYEEPNAGAYTDTYADYDAYQAAFPYPLAPVTDTYYRFECVGGIGTAHGIFRYMGLAKAKVTAGAAGVYNVDIDIIYNHKINNWDTFHGLAIYGSPLRNYMMRHQDANRSFTHLKYGERMKGYVCAENFDKWYKDTDPDIHDSSKPAGVEGVLLYNTNSCVYRLKLGNFLKDVYGGATLSVDIPGVTTGHPEDPNDPTSVLNSPLTLTLGNRFDHQELRDPWAVANTSSQPQTDANTITAYVVGWPGTLDAGEDVTVKLDDNFYGIRYIWKLSRASAFTFKESRYYTFDLTDNPYTTESFTPTTP